mmetsp:Transcript_90021/g.285027  ORF Transcript_90021/g.285027 Transcript_90021/m.285027 type:complete len:190 (-) Transcript_90021:67-636(-)
MPRVPAAVAFAAVLASGNVARALRGAEDGGSASGARGAARRSLAAPLEHNPALRPVLAATPLPARWAHNLTLPAWLLTSPVWLQLGAGGGTATRGTGTDILLVLLILLGLVLIFLLVQNNSNGITFKDSAQDVAAKAKTAVHGAAEVVERRTRDNPAGVSSQASMGPSSPPGLQGERRQQPRRTQKPCC